MSLIFAFIIGAISGAAMLLMFACAVASSERDKWTDGMDDDWEDK